MTAACSVSLIGPMHGSRLIGLVLQLAQRIGSMFEMGFSIQFGSALIVCSILFYFGRGRCVLLLPPRLQKERQSAVV